MKVDLISEANKGKLYCRKFILWPKYWSLYATASNVTLSWKNIKYTKKNLSRLPVKFGVYAFIVKPEIACLLDCNYLLYIGKAKDQTLRVRCGQYFKELKGRKPRILIAQMLTCWKKNLFLYYAELDPNNHDISNVEDNLLGAFLPPMNSQLPGQLSQIAKDIYRS